MKVNMDKARAFANRRSWRAWLQKNHDEERELWLIYYKNHSGKPTISYDDSVEEALCFGWIDGIIQKIDEERFARRFTPRNPASKWSHANLVRMKRMQELGLVNPAAIVPSETTKIVAPRQQDLPIPTELKKALRDEKQARDFFESLAPSYRRMYVRWLLDAKRDETRLLRAQKAVSYLSAGKKMPFK